MWQSANLLFLLFIPSQRLLLFVKVILPILALAMKSNMECVGKYIPKFSLEIITFSYHIFGESTGKRSDKDVPHSHLHGVKENPL